MTDFEARVLDIMGSDDADYVKLEKIRKLTGLDLREFEHAITFKVALMVKKYLNSKPIKF